MKTLMSALVAGVVFAGAQGVFAQEAKTKTVAAINAEKAALSGQTVQVKGKVVKVNNGIMGRNFVHVQDGTGDAAAGSNNLIVTSKDTAKVDDSVTAAGKVILNRDFGSGYMYPLLLEDTKITPAK